MADDESTDPGDVPEPADADGGEDTTSPEQIADLERRYLQARDAWFRSRRLGTERD